MQQVTQPNVGHPVGQLRQPTDQLIVFGDEAAPIA